MRTWYATALRLLPLLTILGCTDGKICKQDAVYLPEGNSKTERVYAYDSAPVATGFNTDQRAETQSFPKSAGRVPGEQREPVTSVRTGHETEARYNPNIQATQKSTADYRLRSFCAFHRTFIMSETFRPEEDVILYWNCWKR
ncbi:MAG: hypothetical protein [Microviridae sp.]|nr:MAG: hypothetical protein [Microviridae sp.]